MANEETKKPDAPAAVPAAKKTDLVAEIGTLTYPRAVENFGKDNALSVMRQVAEIGGHGLFEDAHFTSPIFGGLGMPDPEKIIKPNKADFAKHPEGEFYYQAAMEEYADLQATASENRKKINDLYASVK